MGKRGHLLTARKMSQLLCAIYPWVGPAPNLLTYVISREEQCIIPILQM